MGGAYEAWAEAEVVAEGDGRRTFRLTAAGPPEAIRRIAESPGRTRARTGNTLFDALYALAIEEAIENSAEEIRDDSYGHGKPIRLRAFQTGEKWPYVWTRDLAFSVDLALAQFDPHRAASSLLFKTSGLKDGVRKGAAIQIVQDTGSGGSYPVSTDRVVWALGAYQVLKHLEGSEREAFLERAYGAIRDTIEQDRRLVFDPHDGLYRGEQSFLDWREQSYPLWTAGAVTPIAMSKAVSTNVAHARMLEIASELANLIGDEGWKTRFAGWAAELGEAVNRHFFDGDAGLYSACLLSDVGEPVRVRRYELLGQVLAVFSGIAGPKRRECVVNRYPVGPFGPPVTWPAERSVPIYHNHAIWPFVTAYWIRAAALAGNAEAVERGALSLVRGAALNLSNMENLDFATGRAWARVHGLEGPVVNSRRQLWSVAGYLSMVQDVVFGMDVTMDGIRFLPRVPAGLARSLFPGASAIELQDVRIRGRNIRVCIRLPRPAVDGRGFLKVQSPRLNGRSVGDSFVPFEGLGQDNEWDIQLGAVDTDSCGTVRLLEDSGLEGAAFGPAQPEWDDSGPGAVSVEAGLLTLRFRPASAPGVFFNVYRNGKLHGVRVAKAPWTDEASQDYEKTTYLYALEAEDPQTGNSSHLSPSRFLSGREGDVLGVGSFTVPRAGWHLIRLEYANGSGPVSTGIACGVKRVEIVGEGGGGGYLIMPQTGGWDVFRMSTPVRVWLDPGREYALRVWEDEWCLNMSCLAHNTAYKAHAGGGRDSCNVVAIRALHVLFDAGVGAPGYSA
jgi:hypothetical protein